MKKLLFSILLSLSLVQLFAQSENDKHQVSVILIDMDMVLNSENQKSKFLLGTGLLYSYQLNDLLYVQAGVSSFETNVEDDCRFCFFSNDENADAYYKNKEFRVGFMMEKKSRKADNCSWLLGGTVKYGRADYRAVLIRTDFVFDTTSFEPQEVLVRRTRDITTRYVSTGLDVGFKIYPSEHVFIELVSNASVVAKFTVENPDNTPDNRFNNFNNFNVFNNVRLTGNALEIRAGIRF